MCKKIVQRERFESEEAYESVKGSYVVDSALMATAPQGMIVMHPLPRVDEIAQEVQRPKHPQTEKEAPLIQASLTP